MISSKTLILSSGKGRPLLIQVNQNPSISLRPLLAPLRHAEEGLVCPLRGEDRKWLPDRQNDADPKRTSFMARLRGFH